LCLTLGSNKFVNSVTSWH